MAPAVKRSRVWGMLDERAKVFGYFHGERFVASPLFRAIFQSARAATPPEKANDLAVLQAVCGFDFSRAVSELTFTADPERRDLIAVIALGVPPADALPCLERFDLGMRPMTFQGRSGLGNGQAVIVPEKNLLVIGTHTRVAAFLKAMPAPSGEPPANEYLIVNGSLPNSFGALRTAFVIGNAPGNAANPASASGRTRLLLEMETAGAAEAAALELRARESLKVFPQQMDEDEQLKAALAATLHGLTLAREESKVRATITLGDAETHALLGLTIYGIKRYMQSAKIGEARETLGDLARRLTAHALKHPRRRFPPSAPLVPAVVPAGTKYVSTPAEWQHPSWVALGYDRLDPQYFSYEFETSKDGKRVTIRARGDLDGDGVESRFELDGVIDGRGNPTFAPTPREQSPRE